MAITEHVGAAPLDAAGDEFQARHSEAQARIRRGWEDTLTLPLSHNDRAAVERLLSLSACPVLLHLGDEGLYERIDRLRRQLALERKKDLE